MVFLLSFSFGAAYGGLLRFNQWEFPPVLEEERRMYHAINRTNFWLGFLPYIVVLAQRRYHHWRWRRPTGPWFTPYMEVVKIRWWMYAAAFLSTRFAIEMGSWVYARSWIRSLPPESTLSAFRKETL
jgi:hypothetical protein